MKRLLILILSILIASSAFAGQTINGGRSANDDLTLNGTTSATKDTSYVFIQPSGGGVAVGTTDIDGTPAVGKGIFKGSTNDGSTNIFVGRDSDEANVVIIDTNGNETLSGSIAGTTGKFSGLTDGYIPKHTSDSTGQENSIIYTDGNNIGVGQTSFGASANKVFAVGSGTAPSTSPADAAQTWVQDTGGVAGNAALHMRDEVGNAGPVAFVGVKVASHSATETLTIPQMYQDLNLITGAYTVSMPTAAVGYSTDFMATTAATYSVDVVTGTDVIYLNGTALTAGYKITSDGTIRNRVHCECNVVGYYECWGIMGLQINGGS